MNSYTKICKCRVLCYHVRFCSYRLTPGVPLTISDDNICLLHTIYKSYMLQTEIKRYSSLSFRYRYLSHEGQKHCYWQRSTGWRTWICYQIHCFFGMYLFIDAQPHRRFFAKPTLEIGHGWVIKTCKCMCVINYTCLTFTNNFVCLCQ